jgi:hypothetical protein
LPFQKMDYLQNCAALPQRNNVKDPALQMKDR